MIATKMTDDEVLRILEQSDIALATAGLAEGDILRAEHNQARAAVGELISERDALRDDAERWQIFMDALCTQVVGGSHPLWTSAMMLKRTPKTKSAALRAITKAVDAARAVACAVKGGAR